MKLRGAAYALVLVVTPASAEPCPARAEVGGDAAVVSRVTTELAALGVERGQPAPGCRGVVAEVELTDGGIAVAIRDGSHRSEGRVVSDATVAASWIDSWLRDDLDGTSWLFATPPPVVMQSVAAPAVTAAARESTLSHLAVTVAYEQSWLDDGASATGASAAMCVRVGRACVGGRARLASEGDRTVGLTAMARTDVSLLATASVPITVGRMTIAPEAGVGFGRLATRRIDGCAPTPMCDPMTDPGCTMTPAPECTDANGKTYVGDHFARTAYTPRFSAGVRLSVPLFDHVSLDGIASLAWGPFGHTDAFTVAGMTMNPDGTSAPGTIDGLSLPGEPERAYVLGVGVRVGAP